MIQPVESYETPLGFHRFACDFGEWAERAHDHKTEFFSPVPYYLYCRSIELALKAFLLARGATKPEIASKKLGHNLLPLLAKAKELGLGSAIGVLPEWEHELEQADKLYADKAFEYFHVGTVLARRPSLDVLRQFSKALRAAVRQACLDAADGPPPPHVAEANAKFSRRRRRGKRAA
jgi:hypothetical protein